VILAVGEQLEQANPQRMRESLEEAGLDLVEGPLPIDE
jgi:hypothetical protein